MSQEPELVTVATFPEPSTAGLAKSRLESAGIESFIVGENSNLLYGGNLGGFLLRVRPEDVTDAKLALELPAEPGAAELAEAREKASEPATQKPEEANQSFERTRERIRQIEAKTLRNSPPDPPKRA